MPVSRAVFVMTSTFSGGLSGCASSRALRRHVRRLFSHRPAIAVMWAHDAWAIRRNGPQVSGSRAPTSAADATKVTRFRAPATLPAQQATPPERRMPVPRLASPARLPRDARIYVAGHRGLVGSAIWRLLCADGYSDLLGRTSAELDLRDRRAALAFFAAERPTAVILAAAKVGGIMAN